MTRRDLNDILGRIDILAEEVNTHAPAGQVSAAGFRSDAAGLLVVLTCATYETCVKQTIYDYANRFSPVFGIYAECNYEKINSRIDLNDLFKYSRTFHPEVGDLFKNSYSKIRQKFLIRTKMDMQTSYNQLLRWRHSFAHTGARVTTVEEVLVHHRLAKRIIYTFAESFQNFAG